MKHKTFIISCILTMMTVFASSGSVAQVTYKDYLRADAVMSYSNYVYSAAVEPHWLGDSHYFWYENHEKDGNFFYLVNAETGEITHLADEQVSTFFYFQTSDRQGGGTVVEKKKELHLHGDIIRVFSACQSIL